MASKINQSKPRITDQEKQGYPIFKAIYKRVRNLNKKLLDIESLEKREKDTLKPQQIIKIEKKGQVVKQIEKNEQFALFYKGIIQESDQPVSDKVNTDDLIKIATLLVVGQSIEKYNNCSSSDNLLFEAFNTFYKNITQNKKKNEDQSARIVEIVNLLSDYLKSPKLHSACKDYITFSTEQQTKNIQQNAQIGSQNLKKDKQNKVQQSKNAQQSVQKQELKKQNPKVAYKQKSVTKKTQQKQHTKQSKSWNEMNSSSQQNEEKQRQAQVQETKKEQKKVLNENKQVDSKSEVKQPQKQQGKKQQTGQQNRQKGELNNNSNRPVRNNYNSNNYRRNDNRDNQNRRPYNRNGYNNQKYNDSQNRRKYYDYDRREDEKGNNQKGGRKFYDKQEYKKRVPKKNKDSDSSLEPTPEKRIERKPKFVAK